MIDHYEIHQVKNGWLLTVEGCYGRRDEKWIFLNLDDVFLKIKEMEKMG
jgi:hypothetical protein